MNIAEYFPVLLFVLIATGLGAFLLFAGSFLGPRKPYSEKNAPYECGFETFEESRMRFDVRYYLVAILFILFDLELAFLFPWAMAYGSVGIVGFIAAMIFLLILTAGFIYEWKKGALDWD